MIIILSAPSGGGKTSIAKKLLAEDSNLSLSISATTRVGRSKECDGVDYFFKSRIEFEQMQRKDQFLEIAEIYGNLYGTPKAYVKNQLSQGKNVLFDIDSQGAYQIMQASTYPVIAIFITVPNIEILRSRLNNRDQDSKETIDKRLVLAKKEMGHAKNYDYIVINDNFNKTVIEIQNIISKERKKNNAKKI